ncbi:MAG: FkbM family methyltransferase [Ilumatobacter sp.]|uniref:FkbM family methyltransferase n=1 Tax=Ilumatobacter sp. TaxID=1967498 RepID=UPI003296D09A
MTYRIPLPVGGRLATLDIVDPSTSGVQRQLRRSGLASYEPSTAAALLALFEVAGDGFVFFDVGANIGFYASMAAALFEPASVVAFEPMPAIADIASAIAVANGLHVRVERSAASDTVGFADLHVSPLADTSNSLDASFRNGSETVRVPLVRLDDFTATSSGPQVIKIDVETHEAAVLRGARQTIGTYRPALVVEVLSSRRGRDFASEISSALDGLGYSMYELLEQPTFRAETALRASVGGTRDWLLTPTPIGDDFAIRWETWSRRLAECTADRNSRAPLGPAVRRAWNRGGTGEIVATMRREISRRLEGRRRRRTDTSARARRSV